MNATRTLVFALALTTLVGCARETPQAANDTPAPDTTATASSADAPGLSSCAIDSCSATMRASSSAPHS